MFSSQIDIESKRDIGGGVGFVGGWGVEVGGGGWVGEGVSIVGVVGEEWWGWGEGKGREILHA